MKAQWENTVQPQLNLGFVVIPEEMGLHYTESDELLFSFHIAYTLFLYHHAGDDAELLVYKSQ